MSSVPLRSQLHVDQLLTNIAVKYENKNVIHDKIFPMVAVKKSTDLYRTYDRNWIIPETGRAVGGLAKEHVFAVGTSSYSLQKEALKSYIPDTAAENYDITDLKADVTMDMAEKLMMKKELDCAALFTTTSFSLGTSLTSTDIWITSTGAPIPLLDTAAASVVANSGVMPNYAIMPLATYNAFKNHTSVVDRIKYTSREIGPAILAALIGVDEIHVPNMNYDSGLFGASAATGAIASVWKEDFAFLGYKPSNPGFFQLSSGYMFQRAKPLVRSWRDEEREANVVELDVEYQFKIVASLTGYYINNTI